MRKIIRIAQREYAETVRTKTFILSVLLTPAIIAVIVFFTGRAAQRISGPRPAKRIALTDLSGELSQEIKSSFDTHNRSNPQRQILLQETPSDPDDPEKTSKQQKDKLRRKKIDLYVVMDRDVVTGGKMHLYSRAMKPTEMEMISTVKYLLNRVVTTRRCEQRNISPELLAELRRRVPMEHVELGTSTGVERMRTGGEKIFRMMVPFFFMFMMMMGIFGMGQHMITSVIEEKNSRVIEVLLSAVSPLELMAGKIVGLGGIGLTVMGLWTVAAYGAVRWKGLDIDIPPAMVLYFIVYYALGFLLFSSVLAGIGSICNTIKEAQGLMMPLSLLIIVPMVSWFNLAQHPEGTLARLLSFVPPLTPMVMILRISASSDLSSVEILASVVVLGVSVPVVVWMAAKIFRTGVLMYGKRPKLRELLRWVRQG
jgi:ABC-2 type transport system permease protein